MAMAPEQVPLAAAAYAAWCAAEQKKAVQAVNAMPCKYRWAAGRTGTDYEYLQMIWGVRIAKFQVEIELFSPNRSGNWSRRNDSMLRMKAGC